MKKIIISGITFFAVCMVAKNANAQLASDAPAIPAAKTTVAAKPVTVPAVQTVSSNPPAATKQQSTVTEVSKSTVTAPAGVDIVNGANSKSTTTTKATPVISDQGGVKPVLTAVESKSNPLPVKLEVAPVVEKTTPVEQKANPGTTDSQTKTKTD